MNKIIFLLAAILLAGGCGVDKHHAKYDQLRYDELQKARCNEMASFLSTPLISDEPEEYDAALKRCQDMKALSFDEYKRLAEHGRETGNWDVYQLYPDKQ